jgi:hypothetical protein
MGKPARRPSPAMVVSLIALFVAMSGSAIALQGKNTVDTGDVKKNTLKSNDVKDNNLRGKDVKDGKLTGDDVEDGSLAGADVQDNSLEAADLAPNSVDSLEIADNAVNDAKIADNAVGSAEIADNAVGRSEIAAAGIGGEEIGDNIAPRFGTVVVGGGTAQNGAYNIGDTTAACLAGEELISADGWWLNDTNPGGGEELFISEVETNNGAESIRVVGGNDSGVNRILVAQANCLI